jgi:hypothetical protein
MSLIPASTFEHVDLCYSFRMVQRWLVGLLLALAPVGASAEAPSMFNRLRTLVGEWEAKTDKGATLRVSYRLIANDSALLQSFFTPSGKETLTAFHADGSRVLATHYCAQGNQPRLRLDPTSSNDRLVFVFLDATNLVEPAASHLTRLEIKLESPSQYTEVETYQEAGKPDVTTLRFHRVH